MRAKGQNVITAIDEETTYGEDPGAPDGKKLKNKTNTLTLSQAHLDDETLQGTRHRAAPVLGLKTVEGDITTNLDATNDALLFKHLLGSVSTSGAGDPFTHEITPGELPVGLVIEKGFTDIGEYHKYNGCKIGGFDLEISPEGFAEAVWKVVGKKETRSATPYDASLTEYVRQPFNSAHFEVKEGGVTLGIGRSVKLSTDNMLDEDGHVIDGTLERKDLPEGQVMITGTLEAFFEDDTLLAKARASTESSIEIIMDRNTSPNRKITILMSEVVFEYASPPVEGPTGISVSLPFKAYFNDDAGNTSIKVTILNGLATL